MSSGGASEDVQLPGTHIYLALLEDHGGWVSRTRFTNEFWNRLQDLNSLNHLTLGLDDILNEARSTCFAILGNFPASGDLSSRSALISRGAGTAMRYILGFCFFNYPHLTDREVGQIGMVLFPGARSKGYGREITQGLLVYAFERLHVHRLVARILCPVDPSHPPEKQKQALIETARLCYIFQRYGFHFEGITRGAIAKGGVWQDIHRLSMLDTDWLAVRAEELSTSNNKPDEKPHQNPLEEMEKRHQAERKVILDWCGGITLPGAVGENDDDDETAYYCSDGSEEECGDSDDD